MLSAILPDKIPSSGFAFSIHKAGSTLMHEMIRDVCAARNIPAISLPDLFFHEGIPDHEWAYDPKVLKGIYAGRVYYGFRYLPPILMGPEVKTLMQKSVLLIRDPRDILVSQFFSFGRPNGSHCLPSNKAASNHHKHAQACEIDQYVLDSAPLLLSKFTAYKDHLLSEHPRVYQYETIYFEKQQFLQSIFDQFQIEVPATVVKQVAELHDVRPTVEDPSKHIRQGAPGDHRRKLRPDTIAQLNEQFRDIGQSFGYDLTN